MSIIFCAWFQHVLENESHLVKVKDVNFFEFVKTIFTGVVQNNVIFECKKAVYVRTFHRKNVLMHDVSVRASV